MKELNFKQELTAAFGQPISENPTQVMVEAAYRHHKLDWRYLTIEVGPDDLEEAVRGAKVMGFQGFNCTIPHKVKVIEYERKLKGDTNRECHPNYRTVVVAGLRTIDIKTKNIE